MAGYAIGGISGGYQLYEAFRMPAMVEEQILTQLNQTQKSNWILDLSSIPHCMIADYLDNNFALDALTQFDPIFIQYSDPVTFQAQLNESVINLLDAYKFMLYQIQSGIQPPYFDPRIIVDFSLINLLTLKVT